MSETIAYADAREIILATGREVVTNLNGSEKQVEWATKIVWQTLGDHAELMPRLSKGVTAKALQQITDKIAARTQAAWWIENRGFNGVDLRALFA